MQYWKPEAANEFAGDMMPYWDGERFHLFYLLDRDHHAEQGGLGGHQWAHSSTGDLVNWEHHPLALPIGAPGSTDQHGICTGSIFAHDGIYHAFYATRIRTESSNIEAVCRAAGTDLIHFEKSSDNPMFPAPVGMNPQSHRDPFVFQHPETGAFHMLVTAGAEQPAEQTGPWRERGILAHYTSDDLDEWRYAGPFLPLDKDPYPECPEHFYSNGWWYLMYSQGAQLQYWISKDPLGPWERAGETGTIEPRTLSVPRTASWKDGRRIQVGFLNWRRDSRDDQDYIYAGNVIFRELIQQEDGSFTSQFVPEMMPKTGEPIEWRLECQSSADQVTATNGTIVLDASKEAAVAHITETPADATIQLKFTPDASVTEYGLLLRADADLKTGYRLRVIPAEDRIVLQSWPPGEGGPNVATSVKDLNQGVSLVICLKNSIIDICINDRHTMVERCFDHRGTHLELFAHSSAVKVGDLSISPMIE